MLREPLYWIASNAGYDGQATVDQVRAAPDGHGLNALTGEFGDLIDKGVVDPVRVTRLTLEHAASVAALMLTTEALVAEELIAQPGAMIATGVRRSRRGAGAPVVADLKVTTSWSVARLGAPDLARPAEELAHARVRLASARNDSKRSVDGIEARRARWRRSR